MPRVHGGQGMRWTVILLFVASYASRGSERERESGAGAKGGGRRGSSSWPLYFIFGRNGKHLAHRRRPSILHHSLFPLSSSSTGPGFHSRRLVFSLPFLLTFSCPLCLRPLPWGPPCNGCPGCLGGEPARATVLPPVERAAPFP